MLPTRERDSAARFAFDFCSVQIAGEPLFARLKVEAKALGLSRSARSYARHSGKNLVNTTCDDSRGRWRENRGQQSAGLQPMTQLHFTFFDSLG